MKDGKFEVSDLNEKELITALVSLLVTKNIITKEEFIIFRDAVLNHKNEQLEKELKDYPFMKNIFDTLS